MPRHMCEEVSLNERLLKLKDSDVKIRGLIDARLRLIKMFDGSHHLVLAAMTLQHVIASEIGDGYFVYRRSLNDKTWYRALATESSIDHVVESNDPQTIVNNACDLVVIGIVENYIKAAYGLSRRSLYPQISVGLDYALDNVTVVLNTQDTTFKLASIVQNGMVRSELLMRKITEAIDL